MIEGLKPYPEYKDNGLPWAPSVPQHWDLIPNRGLVQRRKVLVGDRHRDLQLLSLTKRGVIVRDISQMHGKFSSDMGTSQEVRAGDFVFCLFDVPETPRTVGLSSLNGMITGAYTVLEPKGKGNPSYFEQFYIAMDDRKLLSPLYSGLRNTIPVDRFLGTKTPQPPADEQAAIVRFLAALDRRVNRFVRAKRRLIELLTEQKQAIITHAVTRGLDPNVELKPSGLPWVGDVPAHWDLVPNRALLRLRKEVVGASSGEYTLLSLTKRGIIARDMENPEGKFPSSFDTYQVVEPGDFVFCHFDVDETPRAIGLSRLHGMITGAYTRFICTRPEYAQFVYRYYLSLDFGKRLKPLYTGLRKVITKGTFLGAKMPLPPPDEAQALVDHIDSQSSAIDATVTRTEQEIALIREYRTRLVADVVTGKLDVRAAAAALPDPDDAEPEPGEEPVDVDVDPDAAEEAVEEEEVVA